MSEKPENTEDPKKLDDPENTKDEDAQPVDEIEAAVAASKVKEEKQKKQKSFMKRGGIALAILLVGYFVYYLMQPYKGSMAFGVCKVFIELHVQYPTTLKLSSVEEFSTSVRVWYTHTDSFGEYIMEPIQCYFKADDTYGFILDKVTIRRREFDQQVVDDFNNSIGVVFANPPDLTIPYPLDNVLKNLKPN